MHPIPLPASPAHPRPERPVRWARSTALALVLAASGAAVHPGTCAAQLVRGRVEDVGSAEAVEGAMVVLLDEEGRSRGSSLSGAGGDFRIEVPGAGLFRLRTDRIGFRSAYSNFFDVARGDTAYVVVRVDVRPIPLAGIDVEGSGRCRVRPEEGVSTARVWDEARKALAAARWTDEKGLYRYRLVEYLGERDRAGRDVAPPDSTPSEHLMAAPFTALPIDSLASGGWVRSEGEALLYYGPDAAVLLSDFFLDRHCMRLREGEEEAPGLVGLVFEPLAEDGVEIRGVLWLDPASSELRWIDYEYVNLDAFGIRGDAGGRIVFQGLPNGAWIVRDWEIRMPVMGFRRRLAGYRVQGAGVVSVRDGLGRTVFSSEGGVATGTVVDSAGMPVEGAEIRVLDQDRRVRTDAAGIFHVSDMAEGRHRLAVTTPELRSHGWVSAPIVVEARRGEIARARFALPSFPEVALGLCGQGAEGQGIVVGTVLREDGGRPVSGAVVRLGWEAVPGDPSTSAGSGDAEGPGRVEVETRTDGAGRYLQCGVPRGRPVTVEARAGEGWAATATVEISPRARVRVRDLRVSGRRPSG